MKTASFVVALLWNTCSALAQGSLLFANAAPGLNAPITDGFGNRLNGPGFTANLYFSRCCYGLGFTFCIRPARILLDQRIFRWW